MLRSLLPVALCLVVAPHALATTRQTVIEDVSVSVDNGGINPDGFAYRIKGKVLIGGNPCEARGVKALLDQKSRGGVIEVTPLKKLPSRRPHNCPRNWDPVYQTMETVVRGFTSQTSDVLLLNVKQQGNKVSVRSLLDQAAAPGYTGLLDRVSAIGGESTGFGLELATGERLELDLKTHGLASRFLELEGRKVKVQGTFKTVPGTEIPSRRVLEVTSLGALD